MLSKMSSVEEILSGVRPSARLINKLEKNTKPINASPLLRKYLLEFYTKLREELNKRDVKNTKENRDLITTRLVQVANRYSKGWTKKIVEARLNAAREDMKAKNKTPEATPQVTPEVTTLAISKKRDENLFIRKGWNSEVKSILDKKSNDWMRRKWGHIRTGVLAELYYQVLSDTKKRSFREKRNKLKDLARNPKQKFNPLFAAQVFNELKRTLTQLRDKMRSEQTTAKFDLDLPEDIPLPGRFFVPFPLRTYTSFVGSWMDELDENEDAWVPKQPVLLFSFLFDENNAGVVLPKLAPVLATLRFKYASLTENQYKPIKMRKIREKGPWRETDIVQLAVDKTQGLTLSNSGNTLLTILLGVIVEMGRNGGVLQKGLKLDMSSFQNMFCRAYVYLCTAQENYLKQKSKRLLGNPYTFSEWSLKQDSSKPRFPMIFNKVPQSLANLNIRKNNDKPECSACQKGYKTFYGNTWLKGEAPREPVVLDEDGNYVSGGNSEAQCIQQLDDLLKTAGVDMDSKNPWYIDFIGTWQQAQKRLDDFKKKQQELYDIGDPRYDWVDYYYKWIILKVDVAIKKFADISDAQEGQEALIGEALDALDETGIFSTLKNWAGKLAKLGAGAALIAYKIISLILVSPMTQELVIQFCNHIKESICQRIAIENGKAVLVRTKEKDPFTGNKLVFEEFDEDTGKWLNASAVNQKKYAAAAQKKRTDWWKNMAFRFFDVISSGTMLSGWMKTLAEMGTMVFGAVGQGINYLISVLAEIPIIGGVISAIGGTGAIAPVVIAYLQKEAKSSWNQMVTLNRRFTQLKKLYQAMFSGWSDCITLMDEEDPTSGKLIIKDGGGLGQKTYYKSAYYHAQFNIPYYAILVLNELAYREQKRLPNKPADIDAIIETLIRTEFVAGSKAQKKLAEKAIKDQNNVKKLRETLKNLTHEEANEILKQDIDASKAWEEKKKWLGYAALSAAAFAASGGISGVAQTAAAVGGAAKTAAAAAGGATAAKSALDFVKDYPEESAMMGSLFGMSGYRFYEDMTHVKDDYQILEIYRVLDQAGVRKMLFHAKLRDKIQEFKLEKSKLREAPAPPMRLAPWEEFELIMQSKSGFFVYEWAERSYINYETATKFFMKYGSPHVEVSQEQKPTEPTNFPAPGSDDWWEKRRKFQPRLRF